MYRHWHSRGSKVKAQRRHAQKRAAERFGLFLNRDQLNALVKQIQTGYALLVEKQSNRVSVWRVSLPDGGSANVVYDKQRHTIVTFLPPGARQLPDSTDSENGGLQQ